MQGMGNSFRYLCAKNYQNKTWFDRVIEKIKRVQYSLLHMQGRLSDLQFVTSTLNKLLIYRRRESLSLSLIFHALSTSDVVFIFGEMSCSVVRVLILHSFIDTCVCDKDV